MFEKMPNKMPKIEQMEGGFSLTREDLAEIGKNQGQKGIESMANLLKKLVIANRERGVQKNAIPDMLKREAEELLGRFSKESNNAKTGKELLEELEANAEAAAYLKEISPAYVKAPELGKEIEKELEKSEENKE